MIDYAQIQLALNSEFQHSLTLLSVFISYFLLFYLSLCVGQTRNRENETFSSWSYVCLQLLLSFDFFARPTLAFSLIQLFCFHHLYLSSFSFFLFDFSA